MDNSSNTSDTVSRQEEHFRYWMPKRVITEGRWRQSWKTPVTTSRNRASSLPPSPSNRNFWNWDLLQVHPGPWRNEQDHNGNCWSRRNDQRTPWVQTDGWAVWANVLDLSGRPSLGLGGKGAGWGAKVKRHWMLFFSPLHLNEKWEK